MWRLWSFSPSVTLVDGVKTAEYVDNFFSPSDNHITVVFFTTNVMRNSDGTGALKADGVWKIRDFLRISGYTLETIIESHTPNPGMLFTLGLENHVIGFKWFLKVLSARKNLFQDNTSKTHHLERQDVIDESSFLLRYSKCTNYSGHLQSRKLRIDKHVVISRKL